MNSFRSLQLSLALGLACTLIASGCQDRTTRVPYIFQLSPESGAPTAAVAPTGRTPVTDPAVPKHLGVITVNIQGLLNNLSKKRRVLATVADVSYVSVMVKTVDGAEFTQVIQKSAILNGQTTATFSGLLPGAATVTMKAFDATGRIIGATNSAATIVAGQNTPVSLSLTLIPTYTGGSGGSSAPATGSATVNGTIQDGPVVSGTPPVSLSSFSIRSQTGAAIGPDGNFWLPQEPVLPGDHTLVKYDSTGNVVGGQVIGSSIDQTPRDIAFAPDGSYWVIMSDWHARKFSAAGTELLNVQFDAGTPFWTIRTRVAPNGDVWFTGHTDSYPWLWRVKADGSAGGHLMPTLTVLDFDFDAQGNVWAVGLDSDATGEWTCLYKIAPNGNVISKHAKVSYAAGINHYLDYGGVVVDAAGAVWFTDITRNKLRRFDPVTNMLTAEYSVGTEPTQLEYDTSNRLWVIHKDGISRITDQGQVAETFPVTYVSRIRSGSSGVWAVNWDTTSTDPTAHHLSH